MTISVIITAHESRYIEHVLYALSLQTRIADEVIIVVDGHTPAFTTEHRVIRITHAGACIARNTGFAASTGDAVLFLDDDTLLMPECLEQMEQALEDADIAYASYALCGKRNIVKFSTPFSQEVLFRKNIIDTTSLVKRSVLPAEPFDPNIQRLQDWDVWIAVVKNGAHAVHIPEILFLKYTENTGISQDEDFMYWQLYVQKKHGVLPQEGGQPEYSDLFVSDRHQYPSCKAPVQIA